MNDVEYDNMKKLYESGAFEYYSNVDSSGIIDNAEEAREVISEIMNPAYFDAKEDMVTSAAFVYDRKGYASYDSIFSPHRNTSYGSDSDPVIVNVMIRVTKNNPAYDKLMAMRDGELKVQAEKEHAELMREKTALKERLREVEEKLS